MICVLLLMSDLARDCVGSLDVMWPRITRWSDSKILDFPQLCCWPGGQCQPIYAFLIFAQSVLACFAAAMFSLVSMNAGNSAEAIMSCVAVLFLHDVDEKLFPVVSAFREENVLKGWFLFIVFAVLMLGMGAAVFVYVRHMHFD